MATTTTLGFSILSRYSGGGVTAARRDLAALRAQMATINGDLQRHTNLLGGIPQRWKAVGAAVASVAPALVPISAAALQIAGTFATMAVAVGGSLAIYGAAMKGAITRTLEMAKAGKALSPVQKEFVGAVDGMKKAWQNFIKETSGQTLSTATHAVRGLTNGIKLLKPIVDAVHPSVLKAAQLFEAWMKGDSAKRYAGILADISKTALPNLLAAGRSVLNVLGDGFRAFAPLVDGMAKAIRRGAESLNSWSNGGGFERFLGYVKTNGPAVRGFFDAFKDAIRNVFNILKEFSAGSLSVLTDAFRAIAAIDPAGLRAFLQVMLLLKAPFLFLVLNCPPLRDAMIGLLGAMNPAMIYAVAGAFAVLRVAFLLMNTALLTSPLGWLILGLTALGVAIVAIATKTTWFQTAWKYTWNFVKTVASAVWQWLQMAWDTVVKAFVTIWQAVAGPLSAAWNAVWGVMKGLAQGIWLSLQQLWGAFIGTLKAVWDVVGAPLQAAWSMVWNGMKLAAGLVWAALQLGWQLFVTAIQTIWSVVGAPLAAAWGLLWNGIKVVAEGVWNALKLAWNIFTTTFTAAWNVVASVFSAAWNILWTTVQTVASGIWNALKALWNAFVNGGILGVWNTVSGALQAAWNAAWNVIKAAAELVWNGLKVAWNAFLTGVQAVWNTVSAALKAAWNLVWTGIKTVAETIWNGLKAAWQAFLTAVQTAWNTMSAVFKTVWNAVWNFIKTVATTIWNALRTAWQALLTSLTNLWNTFANFFKGIWQATWKWVGDRAKEIWDWLSKKWNDFLEGVKNIWNAARKWIEEKWEETWNWLKDRARGIWNNIIGVVEGGINGVIGLINGLTSAFNKVAKFLHIDVSIGPIGEVKIPRLANGGMVEFAYGGMTGAPKDMRGGGALSGYAPGRDTVPAILSRGEGVLTPEAVRGLGGSGFVHSANRTFAGHRGAGKGGMRWTRDQIARHRGNRTHEGDITRPRFANGGMVGVQRFAVGGMTAAALARAGVSLGMVSQGEYSNGSLSAGTHMGGGVVDISSTSPALVAALRAAGFAAWARTGPAWAGNEHIHAVLMNHPDLSGPARAQVQDFLAGGDGLGAGGGSGGGPPGWLQPLLDKAGEIIERVGKGLGLDGILGSIFGGGGGGDKKEEDDGGGLFGTGIGPDIGPDITPGKNLGDAIGKVFNSAMKLALDLFGVGDLGELMLGLIPNSAFSAGFKWVGDKFGGWSNTMGGLGEGIGKVGDDVVGWVVKFLSNENDKKSEAMQAKLAAASASGGGGGNVQQWAGLAAQALARAGISANQLGAFLALMQAESGGNPMAINNYDSNAMMGQASRGLMQVIPSTFMTYRDPSLPANIFDPLANMTASARYIKARYGGNVPGSPYANGTPGATRGVHLVGEQGPELMNFAGGETVTPAKETASILGGGGALPDDLIGQFEALMSLSQQMASIVQAAWVKVTASGQTAKSALTPVLTDLVKQYGTDVPTSMGTMQASSAAAWLAMQTSTDTTWAAMKAGTFADANDHMAVKMPTWGNEMNTAVSTAWTNMGEATATAWEGMKEGTRGPTNWIIDNSYNNGIRSLWNQVAEVIFEDGAKTLPSVATLAKGGPVHGHGGERADRVPAMLSRGEHVWTAREVHRAGGHHAVQQMRQGVMGRGRGKVRGAHRGCGFALGGWLGGVGAVSGSSPAVGTLDLKRGSMMDTVGDHLDQIDAAVKNSLSGSFYRRMGGSAGVTSPTDWIRQYVEKDDELNAIGSGGPPWIPGVSDAITSFGGYTVNQRTADMLNMAMGLGASFSVTQGSFNTGVAASAGTHDGGGVVDLVPANNTNVGALRAVGFAAWNRGAAWGSPSFSPHIHAVALGDPTVSPGAAAQVMSYLAGGNGLADGGPDNYSGGVPSVDGVAAIGGGRNVDPADLEQRVVSYDRGGFLQPGYTMAYNGTGRPEPVGHHLEPKGSKGIEISMPITINGNANAQEVVDGINSQVLPKLRQYLAKGTGNN